MNCPRWVDLSLAMRMDKSRRSFLKAALGLAVTQAFSPPAFGSRPPVLTAHDIFNTIADSVLPPFVHHGTTTGRLSSNQPNFSSVPKFNRGQVLFEQDFTAVEEQILSQIGWYSFALRELKPSFRIYQSDWHLLGISECLR